MKEIKLTQDKVALVDDEDFDILSQYQWHVYKGKNTFYAGRRTTIQSQNKKKDIKNKQKTILMHRMILKESLGYNDQIDHINRNGLDNRKINLRICTNQQNQMNRSKMNNTSSKYKGVCWDKSRNKWMAKIKIDGKGIHLGRFDDEINVAKVYNKAAIKYFGKFANLNKV